MKPRALLFWLPISLASVVYGYGFDGYTACSKPFRTSKSRAEVPCDFRNQNWCTVPGSAYPWHAVRRFVFENHGLMKRMYGDERHISVLRAEIESNDVADYQNDPHGWAGYHESTLKRYEKPATSTSTTTTTRGPTLSSSPRDASPSASPSSSASATTTSKPNATTEAPMSTSSINALLNTTLANLTVAETTYVTDTDDLTTQTPLETTTTPSDNETSTLRAAAGASTDESESKPQIFQETTEESPMYKLRGINACPVKEEVVAPFWANNTRGEVLALLNLYPFEQYVHWERCTYENKQMFCRQGCRCEQQYRLHRLLAYDPNNDCRGIFSDWFKFPSCCVCRCYDLPSELRITSRSPRERKPKIPFPEWFRSN